MAKIKSDEWKKKISSAKKGQVPWNKGKKMPSWWSHWCKGRTGKNHHGYGKPLSEKTKLKISLAQRGAKNHNWKGGVSKSRINKKYLIWRMGVLAKDHYSCQKCNAKGGKYGSLQSHHIENYSANKKLRYEATNGITFCMKCHIKFHRLYGKNNNNLEQILQYIEKQK